MNAPLAPLLLLAFAGPGDGPGERAVVAGDYEKKVLARVEPGGAVAWRREVRAIHDLQALPGGGLLYQTGFGNVIETDAAGQEVWRYDAPAGAEIHSFTRLPDGGTLVAESGTRKLIEFAPGGAVRLEVPLTVHNPDPHRDTRLVRKTPSGTYLVAHEKDEAVREYDKSGAVVWEYEVGSKVYGVSRLKSGNTLVGTGDGHRVIEVTPAGKVVWELTSADLPGVNLAWVTTVGRLPNGNTVVGNCHAGVDNPQLLEVTPDKTVVWSFRDFETFGNALPVAVLPGVPGADGRSSK